MSACFFLPLPGLLVPVASQMLGASGCMCFRSGIHSEGANALRRCTRTSPRAAWPRRPSSLGRRDGVSVCLCPVEVEVEPCARSFRRGVLLGHATRAGRSSLLSGCVLLAASVRGTSAFNVVLRACVCPGSHSHRSAARALSRISRSPCMHARVCMASPAHALVPHLAAWGSICTTRVPRLIASSACRGLQPHRVLPLLADVC